MPTGYTAAVLDGEITELKDYILHCARAFIPAMRDANWDQQIPKVADISGLEHAQEWFVESSARLTELLNMSEEDKVLKAEEYNQTRKREHEGGKEKDRVARERYDAMIEKVLEWPIPSGYHEKFKKFMLEQLQESRRFDCYYDERPEPTPIPHAEWYSVQLDLAYRNVSRAAERVAEQTERVRKDNDWISDLWASVDEL